MNHQDIKKLIEYPRKGIVSKKIFKKINEDATLFCMSKNTNISEHTSTNQGFVYVIEGNGAFNLEGKGIKMVPGTLIYMEKNAVHSLKVKANTSFLLILIGGKK